jgi:hypothetical protein
MNDIQLLTQAIANLRAGGQTSRVGGSVNKPASYSGRIAEDQEDFLKHFDEYAEFNRWEAEYKCKAMLNFLASVAFDFFYTLPEDVRLNYDRLQECMREKFNPNTFVKGQELHTKVQVPQEPLENYIEAVLRMCARAGKSPEDHFVGFIHSLRPALKNFVLSQNVASIEQALNSARLGDSLYPEGKAQVMSIDTIGGPRNNQLEKKVDKLVCAVSNLVKQQNKKPGSENIRRVKIGLRHFAIPEPQMETPFVGVVYGWDIQQHTVEPQNQCPETEGLTIVQHIMIIGLIISMLNRTGPV